MGEYLKGKGCPSGGIATTRVARAAAKAASTKLMANHEDEVEEEMDSDTLPPPRIDLSSIIGCGMEEAWPAGISSRRRYERD
jgi:hypothetical protein